MLKHSMVAGLKSASCSEIQRAAIDTLRFTDGILISELERRGDLLGVYQRNGHHEWFQFFCKGVGDMNQSQVAVWAIVREFAKHAFDKQAFVTGGYPRDLHFGRLPKDVDITIPLGDYDAAKAYSAAENLCAALAGVGTSVEVSQAYDQANGDFNERIHILIQVHCKDGQEVDIMFHKAADLAGVFSTYDSNINQVWLDGGVPVWHAGHPPVECVGLKELTSERIVRIHAVAAQIGLPIVEASFTAKPSPVPYKMSDIEDDFPF